MRIRNLILLLFVFITVSTHAQSNHNYEMTKVSDNVYQFHQKEFANMFAFVTDEGILLIDSGFDEIAESVIKELNDITDGKIKYIINTHSDYDHIAGNGKLREDAIVISHDNSRDELIMFGSPELEIPFDKTHYHNALPDITFEDDMTLHFGGETINIFKAIGGHTTTDIVVHLEKENMAFIGDIFFTGSFPHIKEREGTSIDNLLKVVDLMITKLPENVSIGVGHGAQTDFTMLEKFKEMVEKTTHIVNTEIMKGRTLEEIQNDNVLKDWTGWSQTVFEEIDCNTWIEAIFNDYQRNK